MNDRLEVALRELAAEIAYPPTPGLRSVPSTRLVGPVRNRWWPGPMPRALVLALVATLVLAAAAAALVLTLPGLRITFVPELPTSALGTRLALGEPAAIDTLKTRVIAQLSTALGTPDEAYVAGGGGVVTLIYAADASLPEIGDTGIGLLVQQIDGVLDRGQVEKLVPEVGATVARVEVAGVPAFWIEGDAHVVRFTDPSGSEGTAPGRLAGDTLVWERGGYLYRIESGLGRAATIDIAEAISD